MLINNKVILKKYTINHSLFDFQENKLVMRLWRIWKRKMRLISALVLFPLILLFFVIISFQSDLTEQNTNSMRILHRNAKQTEYIDKRGIHVIVGHYIGNDLPWDTTPNLTDGK